MIHRCQNSAICSVNFDPRSILYGLLIKEQSREKKEKKIVVFIDEQVDKYNKVHRNKHIPFEGR